MHGTVAAVAGLQKSDLIISLGARFDDRVTGNLDSFAPGAKVIHADIDPAEIGKNRLADVPIVGDCREVIADLIVALQAEPTRATPATTRRWVDVPGRRQEAVPARATTTPSDGSLAPQYVIERLGAIAGPDAIYCAGVGQHQMWAAHFVGYEKPNTWINSGGLGTMGFAVPAAMGAKVGCPDDDRVGDRRRRLLPDDQPGARHLRDQGASRSRSRSSTTSRSAWSGSGRRCSTTSATPTPTCTAKRIPDFVKLAEAYGCVGLACDSPDDVDATINKAMEINDVPVVVDFRVHRDAMVWPMVAAGTSNDDIKYARDLAPEFEEDDL